MTKVLRGYSKRKDDGLVLIGTIPVPHSKDKPSPRERKDKRDLVRRGATVFKKTFLVGNATLSFGQFDIAERHTAARPDARSNVDEKWCTTVAEGEPCPEVVLVRLVVQEPRAVDRQHGALFYQRQICWRAHL